MSIVLTKEINGKKVKLDLISLNGKTTVRSEAVAKAKKQGVTEKELTDLGYEIEGKKAEKSDIVE